MRLMIAASGDHQSLIRAACVEAHHLQNNNDETVALKKSTMITTMTKRSMTTWLDNDGDGGLEDDNVVEDTTQ